MRRVGLSDEPKTVAPLIPPDPGLASRQGNRETDNLTGRNHSRKDAIPCLCVVCHQSPKPIRSIFMPSPMNAIPHSVRFYSSARLRRVVRAARALLAFTVILALNQPLNAQTAGTLDPAFSPDVTGGDVQAIAVQPDGKILLAGCLREWTASRAVELRG